MFERVCSNLFCIGSCFFIIFLRFYKNHFPLQLCLLIAAAILVSLFSDDIVVTGVLTAKWSPDLKDVRCDLDPVLIANHVR